MQRLAHRRCTKQFLWKGIDENVLLKVFFFINFLHWRHFQQLPADGAV